MDIACPHCAATYRVPESLVAGGKALRCAACGREWVPQGEAERGAGPAAAPDPEPLAALPSAPPQADPPPLLPRREPGQRPTEERHRALLPAAWVASIAAVALGLAALYLWRAPIAAAWPPFGRLF